jgi:dimethylhistidine N-methyltransferase
MLEPNYLTESEFHDSSSLSNEIEEGLLADSASISPKFLYDILGSHLFTAITLLPEYYPTKTEKDILNTYQSQIADSLGLGKGLIDLGAGNCQKAESLFKSLDISSYIAIDFSIDYLKEILPQLQNKYPKIRMYGIGVDFSHQFQLPSSISTLDTNFFYPGSSIGNFTPIEAQHFLKQVKLQTHNAGLLIGVDLMKDDTVLMDAYDDPLKLTAAFNLNILRSINAQIGANFDVTHFKHTIKINHKLQRVELYLEALQNTTVNWSTGERSFRKGELIHTENSHKYSMQSIKELLSACGFNSFETWTDSKNYFALIYAI